MIRLLFCALSLIALLELPAHSWFNTHCEPTSDTRPSHRYYDLTGLGQFVSYDVIERRYVCPHNRSVWRYWRDTDQ